MLVDPAARATPIWYARERVADVHSMGNHRQSRSREQGRRTTASRQVRYRELSLGVSGRCAEHPPLGYTSISLAPRPAHSRGLRRGDDGICQFSWDGNLLFIFSIFV